MSSARVPEPWLLASFVPRGAATAIVDARSRFRFSALLGAYLALALLSVAVKLLGGPSTVRWFAPSFGVGDFVFPMPVVFAIALLFYWDSRCVLVDQWGVTVRNGFWAKERIDWLDVRAILVAERQHLTFVTRDREVAARMLPSFADWVSGINTSRRLRMRSEVIAVRDWLDQCRRTAVAGADSSWDRPGI